MRDNRKKELLKQSSSENTRDKNYFNSVNSSLVGSDFQKKEEDKVE